MDSTIKNLVERPRKSKGSGTRLIVILTVVLVNFFFTVIYFHNTRLSIRKENWEIQDAIAIYSSKPHSATIDAKALTTREGEILCAGLKVGDVRYGNENLKPGNVYSCDSGGKCSFNDAVSFDKMKNQLTINNLEVMTENLVYEGKRVVQADRPLRLEKVHSIDSFLTVNEGELVLNTSPKSFVTTDEIPKDALPIFRGTKDAHLISSNLFLKRELLADVKPYSLLYADERNVITPLEIPPIRENSFYVLTADKNGVYWHPFPKIYELDIGPPEHVLVRLVNDEYRWEPRTFAYHGNVIFEAAYLPTAQRTNSLVAFDTNYKSLKNVPIPLAPPTDFSDFLYVVRLKNGGLGLAPRMLPPDDGSLGILSHDSKRFVIGTQKTDHESLFGNDWEHLIYRYDGGLKGCLKILKANADLEGHRLHNLGLPTEDDDLVSLGYAQNKYMCRTGNQDFDAKHKPLVNIPAPKRDDQLVPMWFFVRSVGLTKSADGKISANNLKLINLSEPVEIDDVATKGFVDEQPTTLWLYFSLSEDLSKTTKKFIYQDIPGVTEYNFYQRTFTILQIRTYATIAHVGKLNVKLNLGKKVEEKYISLDEKTRAFYYNLNWSYNQPGTLAVTLDSTPHPKTNYYVHIRCLVA